jgi:cytochrome P450
MPALLSSVAQHGSIEPLLYEWATTVGRNSDGILQWRVPGAPPVALVASPDAVRAIFEASDPPWPKSPLYQDLEPLLGAQSLVLTEGQEWREQRDAFNPGFSGAFLRVGFGGFRDATRELVAVLDEVAEGVSGAGAVVDDDGTERSTGAQGGVCRIWDLVVLATVEIIFRVGFGEPRGLLSRPDRDPLQDTLYRAFYDLGTHVSWFLDNVPLNRLKYLPWNVSKTRRLREGLERELGAVLDGRIEAMRRTGRLPRGVAVVDKKRRKGGEEEGAGGGKKCPMAALAGAAAAASAGGGGGSGAAAAGAPQQPQQQQQEAGGLGSAPPPPPPSDRAATLLDDDQQAVASPSSRAASPSSSTPSSLSLADGGDILSMAVATLAASGAREIDRSALLSQQATLFAAGHDTTAGAISWAVYFLSRDPARRARLVRELDAVFEAQRREKRQAGGDGGADEGKDGDNDDDVDLPTWEELSNLPYLTAVLKETLRFRPPVGIIARACPAPAPSADAAADAIAAAAASPPRGASEGEISGYDLRGAIAVVSPYVLHRLEQYWGKDAAEWVPERWLDNEGVEDDEAAAGQPALPRKPARALSVPQYAYVPFSRGARDCIGSRFAVVEAKVILAALFRRYEFEWAGPADGERVRMALTAHPARGVPMRVRRRGPGRAGAEAAGRAAAEAKEAAGVVPAASR